MRICGVELKASQATLALIETDEEFVSYIPTKSKKIVLSDDESSVSIRHFFEACAAYCEAHEVDLIAIKKRNKKGNFSGGAVSFKMEALWQLCPVPSLLLAAPSIAATQKKQRYTQPEELKKYQQQAFWTACTAHSKQLEQKKDKEAS